jgi:hypothetical protein
MAVPAKHTRAHRSDGVSPVSGAGVVLDSAFLPDE